MIKRVKNTVLWTYVIRVVKREEIVGTFHKNELLKKEIGKSLELKS